jgi:D-ribose pyranase
MKKRGILNAELARELARLGHTHEVVIADCGLPLPNGVATVDLALLPGVPSFFQVLDAVLDEIVVAGATAAQEIVTANPAGWAGLVGRLEPLAGPITLVGHEELKAGLGRARLLVRTGEARPYANVILRCGVPF